MVAAGAPAFTPAVDGAVEITLAMPEDQIATVRAGDPVEVTLWIDASRVLPVSIREVAASADPATSTLAFREVAVRGAVENSVIVGAGLADGERIVTTGVGLVRAGQKVRLLSEAGTPAPCPDRPCP